MVRQTLNVVYAGFNMKETMMHMVSGGSLSRSWPWRAHHVSKTSSGPQREHNSSQT